MKKILFHRKNFIVFFTYIIVILFIIYLPHIMSFITFSVEPQEGFTTLELIKMRNMFLKENLRYTLNVSSYLNFRYRLTVILGIFLGSLFLEYRDNLLKYNIGRNENYEKEKRKSKGYTALFAVILSLIIIMIIFFIGMFSKNYEEIMLHFNKNSFLYSFFLNRKFLAIIFHVILLEIFEFLIVYYILTVIDKFGLIKGIFINIFTIWIIQYFLASLSLYFFIDYVPTVGLVFVASEAMSFAYIIKNIIVMFLWIYLIKCIGIKEKYEIR